MGLMLHANGKGLIRRQMFKDALEVLTMGEVCTSIYLNGYPFLIDSKFNFYGLNSKPFILSMLY